jgi:hypothetical protein
MIAEQPDHDNQTDGDQHGDQPVFDGRQCARVPE